MIVYLAFSEHDNEDLGNQQTQSRNKTAETRQQMKNTLVNALKTGFECMGFPLPKFIFGSSATPLNQKKKDEKERIKQANFQKKVMNRKKNGIGRGK